MTQKTSQNLLQIFKTTVDLRGNRPCFQFKEEGKWKTLSWKEAYDCVVNLAGALQKLGIKRGDKVSLFSHSRYEWSLTDLAILSCGAITVPIYESSTPDTARYILENAEVKVIFLDNVNQLKKIRQIHSSLPQLKQIIVFDDLGRKEREEGVYTFDELMVMGSGGSSSIFEKMVQELTPEDVASYVYTSGTTGPPKGAVLTHGNFLAELEATESIFNFSDRHVSLLFLPLAHIFARAVHFAQMKHGFIQAYAESIDKLLDNIAEVRPHLMASVPRIFEKVHTRVMQGLEGASPFKKKIFSWALEVGRERSERLRKHQFLSPLLQVKWLAAYKLVFSKLHAKMGGRLMVFISGGAPLSQEIADFFHSAGFIILEGYGLTETTAAITCNDLKHYKIGVVGKTLPGVSIKIASDGEILAKGGVIFKGYYKRPEDTAQVLTQEGWFHTGDIGQFDEDGFLKITDRKKDIIVTAGGKNVAPQNIENFIKADPLISQVMVHGDKRKFLSALITLDRPEVERFAKDHRIDYRDYADLVKNDKLYHFIKNRIEEKNKQLAKYETIKKFAILENDFSVESGELTPTMKVRRKFTSEKYKNILDQFYQE